MNEKPNYYGSQLTCEDRMQPNYGRGISRGDYKPRGRGRGGHGQNYYTQGGSRQDYSNRGGRQNYSERSADYNEQGSGVYRGGRGGRGGYRRYNYRDEEQGPSSRDSDHPSVALYRASSSGNQESQSTKLDQVGGHFRNTTVSNTPRVSKSIQKSNAKPIKLGRRMFTFPLKGKNFDHRGVPLPNDFWAVINHYDEQPGYIFNPKSDIVEKYISTNDVIKSQAHSSVLQRQDKKARTTTSNVVEFETARIIETYKRIPILKGIVGDRDSFIYDVRKIGFQYVHEAQLFKKLFRNRAAKMCQKSSEGRTLFELSPFSDRAPTFTEKEKDEEKETIDALFVILRRAGRLTKEQLFTGYLKLFEYKLSKLKEFETVDELDEFMANRVNAFEKKFDLYNNQSLGFKLYFPSVTNLVWWNSQTNNGVVDAALFQTFRSLPSRNEAEVRDGFEMVFFDWAFDESEMDYGTEVVDSDERDYKSLLQFFEKFPHLFIVKTMQIKEEDEKTRYQVQLTDIAKSIPSLWNSSLISHEIDFETLDESRRFHLPGKVMSCVDGQLRVVTHLSKYNRCMAFVKNIINIGHPTPLLSCAKVSMDVTVQYKSKNFFRINKVVDAPSFEEDQMFTTFYYDNGLNAKRVNINSVSVDHHLALDLEPIRDLEDDEELSTSQNSGLPPLTSAQKMILDEEKELIQVLDEIIGEEEMTQKELALAIDENHLFFPDAEMVLDEAKLRPYLFVAIDDTVEKITEEKRKIYLKLLEVIDKKFRDKFFTLKDLVGCYKEIGIDMDLKKAEKRLRYLDNILYIRNNNGRKLYNLLAFVEPNSHMVLHQRHRSKFSPNPA